MKFTTKAPQLAPIAKIKSNVLGLAIENGDLSTKLGKEINRKLGGWITQILKKEDLKGKIGETRLIDTHGKIASENILLIGIGSDKPDKKDEKTKTPPDETDLLRKSSAKLVKTGNRLKAGSVTIEDFSKTPAEARGQAFSEGAVLGSYSFDQYKSKPHSKKSVQELIVLTNEGSKVQKGLERGAVFAEATNLARDLINIPANDMTPRRMAEEARKIGKLPGLSVKVLGKAEIQRLGMGCYLAVSSGSIEPPRFIHLHYRPKGRSRKRIAIVGKGVTFDSGGLSLKTAQGMETMKDDMSGAAAMVAVMKALSILKPPVEVHGIAAMTENMPSGSSDKPGDIARAMNGKTVEILNTDAEGRLTLADAVGYVQKLKPDVLVDVATLTGACVIALGELCSGILGNNEGLINRLIACGKAAGEKLWPLPLIDEYRDELKSSIADLKNIGGRWGGTINGALFIQEFIDPKIPWAHIDIAGPSWTERELDYCPRGGTGHIVRTLLNFVLQN